MSLDWQEGSSGRRVASDGVLVIPDDAMVIVPIRNVVLFPGMILPLTIGREPSILAAQQAVKTEHPVGILLQRDAEVEVPGPDDLCLVGTVANILAPELSRAEQMRHLEGEVERRTRQLDDEKRFTEQIVDSLPVGLYVIDREYRVQAWNRKRETGMQGISREQALGRTIFEILHRPPQPDHDEQRHAGRQNLAEIRPVPSRQHVGLSLIHI